MGKLAALYVASETPGPLMGALGRRFEVSVARSAPEALDRAQRDSPALALVDLDVPETGPLLMRSIASHCKELVAVLLCPPNDLSRAVAAANEVRFSRFVVKPAAVESTVQACIAASREYRSRLAERVLPERMLHGSVKALTEILALALPEAFGRANRIRATVKQLSQEAQLQESWPVELAAMLLPLGFIGVPDDLLRKHHQGAPLTAEEQNAIRGVPELSVRLLSSIPQLEVVCELLLLCETPDRARASNPEVAMGANILRIASDFDRLTLSHSAVEALSLLQADPNRYDPVLVRKLLGAGAALPGPVVRRLALDELTPGMVLAEDLLTTSGALLVARGAQVSVGLLARLRSRRRQLRNGVAVTTFPTAQGSG